MRELRRLPRPARAAVAVTVAAAAVAAVGMAAWRVEVPKVARARAERLLAARSGMTADIGGVDVDLDGVSFAEVRLRGRRGGLSMDLRNVRVDGPLAALALRRPHALSAVRIGHLEASIDLRRPGAEASIEAVREAVLGRRGGRSRKGGSADAAGVSALLADDFTLDLAEGRFSGRDDDGDRLLLDGVAAEVEPMGHGRYRVAARGEADRGGNVRFRGVVEPAALRADGTLAVRDLSLLVLVPILPRVPWYRPGRTRVSGRLELRSSPDALVGNGSLSLTDAAFAADGLADAPVQHVELGFEGGLRLHPESRRLEIVDGTVTLDGVAVRAEGEIGGRPEATTVRLDLDLPPTRCEDAMAAIPADLLGDLGGFAWTGSMSGRLALDLDSARPEATSVSVDVHDRCTFVRVPAAARVERFKGPFLLVARQRDGTAWSVETGPGTRAWVPMARISPFLVQAVLAHEDAGFLRHHGFATYAIEQALERDLAEGRFAYGASTITMQLAKNLFLDRAKTLARKVREVVLTWWLERALSKREILELYLNVVELGPGIYGVRSAARTYFGRPPAALSPGEAAFLAAILPDPRRSFRDLERGRLSAGVARQMRFLLEHMHDKGRIDAAAMDYGLAEVDRFAFRSGVRPAELPAGDMGAASPLPFATASERAAERWRSPRSPQR